MYTVLLADQAGQVYGELDASTIQYKHELNGVGSFALGIRSDSNKIQNTKLEPWQTNIWIVDGDGIPQFGGIVHAFDYSPNSNNETINLRGGSIASIFERRFLRTNLEFTNKTTGHMLREIVSQMDAANDTGITFEIYEPIEDTLEYSTSWQASSPRNFISIITNIAEMDDGFEYNLEYRGSQRDGFRLVIKAEKTIGQVNGRTLDTEKNCEIGGISVSGDDYTNGVIFVANEERGRGGTTQITPLVGEAQRVEPGHYRIETVHTDTTKPINTQETADAEATQILETQNQNMIQMSITLVDPDYGIPTQALGAYQVGDIVKVIARNSFRPILDNFKIQSISTTIAEDGYPNQTLEVLQSSLAKNKRKDKTALWNVFTKIEERVNNLETRL